MQQCFELMCRNRKGAKTLHQAHGHPTNRKLLFNLEAKGIPHKQLECYILAVSYDVSRAAIGKHDNKTSTAALTKRQVVAQQKKADKIQRKLSGQRKSILISSSNSTHDSEKLELSLSTDIVDPTSTITEWLARFHELTGSIDSFDYSTLKPSLPNLMIGGDMPLDSENFRYQWSFNENAAIQSFNDTFYAPSVA